MDTNNKKVYNKDKTIELTEYDLTKGYLKPEILTIHHEAVDAIPEEGHEELIAEYPNGGKDMLWVVDVPGVDPVEAYDEDIEIYVYIEYTQKELKTFEIDKYKDELNKSDYKAIKYFEGFYTDEEYEPIRNRREYLREQIRKLTEELENDKDS